MADDFKRIEESTVHSHPFKAHYHGTETGDPGYLAIESGYIVPVGFATGLESILPTLKGEPLQDQMHTGELTFIKDPPVGDYYMEATGEWRTTGMDGDNKIEMFEPHKAEILHHGNLTLTDDKKRALKVFRLESDGRVTQYIKSDIPMAPARTVPHVPPPEPPEPGSDSDSSKSSSSASSMSGSGSWPPVWGSDSSSTAPTRWATFVDQVYPELLYPGVSSNVQVRMRNDGDVTWETGYKLLPQANDWGVFEVALPGTTVKGVTREFNFTIQAPMTPGTYAFEWQLYGQGTLFGEKTDRVNILVPPTPPTPSTPISASSSSAGPPPPYDYATFVHQHVIPEEMFLNEEAWVQVTFRNTGTTTWETGMYKLLPMRHHWGNFEIALPTRTPPGVERTFDITMTAPGAPGTYWWQWQMYGPNGVFAQIGAEKAVIVSMKPIIPPPQPSSGGPGSSSGAPLSTNAAFVNWFVVPDEMLVNETTWVQITMRNTGSAPWYPGYHKLLPQSDVWGVFEVGLMNVVLPGAEHTFDVEFYAPAAPGVYDFQWQMYNGATGSHFGQMTPNEPIMVRMPPPPIIPPSSGSDGGSGSVPPVPPSGVSSNNATFVHQFPVPTSLPAGGSADVQITFRNTGSTTWTSGRHMLVAKTPDFNTFWGVSQKAVSTTAPPGVERVFYLHLTASSTGGNYPFRWQMYDSLAEDFFGEMTPEVNIYVAPPSASVSTSSS